MNLYVCMWNMIACDVGDDVEMRLCMLCMYMGGVVTMLDIPRGGNKSFKHSWRKKGVA